MPIPLSRKSRRVAEYLFSEPRLSLISSRLITEASENIPFHEKSSSNDMDRIRFSIMKLASMPGADDDSIFDLAKTDWRDLFMAAGFGYSADEHLKWYKEFLPDEIEDDNSPEGPWWAFWRKK